MFRATTLAVLLALVSTAPAWAADSSTLDAGSVDANALGIGTPWGYLDVALSDTPTSLPFRVRLEPRSESSGPGPAVTAVPYVAIGRVDRLDSNVPDGVRSLTQDRNGPVKTAAGLTWLLGPNVEISGEYQFASLRAQGFRLAPSTLEKAITTGPESLGFNLNLSIRY